jgi:hypothetical protein
MTDNPRRRGSGCTLGPGLYDGPVLGEGVLAVEANGGGINDVADGAVGRLLPISLDVGQ